MESKRKYLFCMSSGYSLKLWEDKGLIERELVLIKRLTFDFDVTIFTYGSFEVENDLLKKYDVDAKLLAINYSGKFQILYSLFYVVFGMSNCRFYFLRSNQFSGSWVPFLYKVLYMRQAFFILRNGYNYFDHFVSKSILPYKIIFNIVQLQIVLRTNLIICTNDKDVKYFKNLGGKDVVKIYNSINLDLFNTFPRPNINVRYDFLVIAKISDQKNLLVTLRILGETGKKVLFIGDGHDKKLLLEIHEVLGRYHNISHMRRVDNFKIPFLMRECRTLVNLAHYEGNPKVVIEAYACGLKLILSRIPAHLEMKSIFDDRAIFLDLNRISDFSFSKFLDDANEGPIGMQINVDPFNFEKNYQQEINKFKHENFLQ